MKTDSLHSITAPADSLQAADSTAAHRPYQPKYTDGFGNSHECDSTIESLQQSSLLTIPTGDKSEYYVPSPLHDTGTMTVFLVSVFLVCLCIRIGYKYITDFKKNLFSLRKRDNLFDEHNTVNEVLTQIMLIANTCIMEGILINGAFMVYFPSFIHSNGIFTHISAFIAIMLLFYLLQFVAYTVLGFVFTTKSNTSLLLKGFNASQALLGITLVPVVILLLVYTTYAQLFINCFLILYILSRIVFLIKGFRIFFTNYTSILYFILYLCSGEIVPLIIVYGGLMLFFTTN